jgi:hypothetical protein
VADTDSDNDGTADCLDLCPADSNKTAAGICGCGVSDADSDGDGTADCNDGCPADGGKTAAGICGCGVADTDSDADGTANCNDACAADPNKTALGQCGCGVADTDSDNDGTANCNDGCPANPARTAGVWTTVAHTWDNIAGTGTLLSTLSNTDDGSASITIPFSFAWYGANYTQIGVSTNGVLIPGGSNADYSNVGIPSASAPGNLIAPFWDDLVNDSQIRWQVLGSSPNRRLVVSWLNVGFYSDMSSRTTFQAVLRENGTVSFAYNAGSANAYGNGSSATIGVQNSTGSAGSAFSNSAASVTYPMTRLLSCN